MALDDPKEETPRAVAEGGVLVGTEEEMRALFERLKAEEDEALAIGRQEAEGVDANTGESDEDASTA